MYVRWLSVIDIVKSHHILMELLFDISIILRRNFLLTTEEQSMIGDSLDQSESRQIMGMNLVGGSIWQLQIAQVSSLEFLQLRTCQVLLIDVVHRLTPDRILVVCQKLGELALVEVLHHVLLIIIDRCFAQR